MNKHQLISSTRTAFLWARLLNMPCWSLMTMLAVLLYKEMHITPFQITVIIALKPISALLASYWSHSVYRKQERLVPNIIYGNILQYIPLLFFPWISSPWLIILAFGIYMMLNRGVIPTWMEIFKQNIPPITREQTFSFGSILDYLGAVIIPSLLGLFLDYYPFSWSFIFPCVALLGLSSTYFLTKIPISNEKKYKTAPAEKFHFLGPLKRTFSLIKQRPDFGQFQLGFMLGGGGLMIMQPALPFFFVDLLHLSFTQMGLAIAACKGIGFILASPFWRKLFSTIDIFRFSGLVTFLAALFPLILLFSQYSISLLCIAYLVYGVMQAGSELSWHLSGPLFARDDDSTAYSNTNVLTVGLRGCIFPFLGSWLYSMTNPFVVMLLGAFLCTLATVSLLQSSKVRTLSAE